MFDEETTHMYMKKSKKDLVAIIEALNSSMVGQMDDNISLKQRNESICIEAERFKKTITEKAEESAAQKRLLLLSNNNYHELENIITQISALNFPEWPRLGNNSIGIDDNGVSSAYDKSISPREKAPEEYRRLHYILEMISKGKFMTDLSGYDKSSIKGECDFVHSTRANSNRF